LTRPRPRRCGELPELRSRLDPAVCAQSIGGGAAGHGRSGATTGALRQRPPLGAGPVGRAHRFERRGGGLSGRDRGFAGPPEPDSGLRSDRPQRHLPGRRGDRGAPELRARPRPVLSGGFRRARFQPDRWQHRHQRRGHQGHPLRPDSRLGDRIDSGHRTR